MTVIETTGEMDLKRMVKLPIIDKNKPANYKYSDKEEKFMRDTCTYEFINMENPGLAQVFHYGNAKNKIKLTLFHGGKYRLPRFIANHINSCGTPMWGFKPDGMGNMNKEKTGTKPRFQCREVYEG